MTGGLIVSQARGGGSGANLHAPELHVPSKVGGPELRREELLIGRAGGLADELLRAMPIALALFPGTILRCGATGIGLRDSLRRVELLTSELAIAIGAPLPPAPSPERCC
jgi:hypothetical protein